MAQTSPIIRDKIQPDSIVYSDCWRGYNVRKVSPHKNKMEILWLSIY
ncbi:MAG: hypothetical protein KAJ29_06465 [Alphaproteobacteria bacterium]|nr:hypothetical protein [Alphaproteobacteria bacterium]